MFVFHDDENDPSVANVITVENQAYHCAKEHLLTTMYVIL